MFVKIGKQRNMTLVACFQKLSHQPVKQTNQQQQQKTQKSKKKEKKKHNKTTKTITLNEKEKGIINPIKLFKLM